jgi:hypothetical protein
MAKPYKLPPFTVVVDTNAIYPKDVTNIVGPKFLDLWKECAALTHLRLVIPEVVRGERLYQLTVVAQQALDSAAKSLERLVKVSGGVAPKTPDLDGVKNAIETRFDAWVKEFGAIIAPIPFNKIEWPKVVGDAIWRVRPFTPPADEKDSEKGFRDCLILETLGELVHSTTEQVVFISKDSLLRETAVGRFAAKEFAAYEDVAGFASYLNLAKDKTNQAFAQAVLQKVPQIFYTPNDPNCVYNKFDVASRIFKQFSGLLNVLFEKPQPNLGFAGLATGSLFAPISDDKIFIDSTEFINNPGYRGAQWKTRVRLVRLFRKQSNQPAFFQGLDFFNEIIRIQPFDVFWQADIDIETNFSNLNLANITASEQTTEPGFLNKSKYGFIEAPPPQKPQ